GRLDLYHAAKRIARATKVAVELADVDRLADVGTAVLRLLASGRKLSQRFVPAPQGTQSSRSLIVDPSDLFVRVIEIVGARGAVQYYEDLFPSARSVKRVRELQPPSQGTRSGGYGLA